MTGLGGYHDISVLVDKANDKKTQQLWRHAYERLIFLLLQKQCGYDPKRFVESRLFAELGLKPYHQEKLSCLKQRLVQLQLCYDVELRTMSHIARVLRSVYRETVADLVHVIPSQHIRTTLYNQGVKMGVYGSKGTVFDFLQRCTQLGPARHGVYTYVHRQDGFLTSKGAGPELVKRMEAVLSHYGIDPRITAAELDYLSML